MAIKLDVTDKVISTRGGMIVFKRLLDKVGLVDSLYSIMPKLKVLMHRNAMKAEGLLLGFSAGAECLDDQAVLNRDAAFAAVTPKDYTAKSYGDFLRQFKPVHLKLMQYELINRSFALRQAIYPKSESITFDIDSTSNPQYGRKMEGVARNYDGIDCLDTIKAFDECGLEYWHWVRPGNTFSGNSVGEIISGIFSRMPKTKDFQYVRRYARLDSAFCNTETFNACHEYRVGFVTSMRENMFEKPVAGVKHWEKQNPSKPNRIKFYDGRECEIGETVYRPDEGKETLRVVAIRAEKPVKPGMLIKEIEYDYYAWCTNIGAHEMKAEKLIKFYRGRGTAENHIKNMKYGLDLKHYPCLKLNANRAYGLLAAFAYNLLRFLALQQAKGKDRVHHMKHLRLKLISIPVQLVRHAGDIVFKFMEHHLEEVKKALDDITKFQCSSA